MIIKSLKLDNVTFYKGLAVPCVLYIPFLVFGLCLHFARQDGQDGKKGKKITQLKRPKYKKTNDENMGWTEHK